MLPEKDLNDKGHFTLGNGATNNYGELLACKYALQIALKEGAKIFLATVRWFWIIGQKATPKKKSVRTR